MPPIILNFHGIGSATRKLNPSEHEYWLDIDYFEAVLDLVKGKQHVQLTFDDGNASDAEIVLPALIHRGLHAIFFVCSGYLDKLGFLTQIQVASLKQHGMQIGTHGVSHTSWPGLSSDRLYHEIEYSRKILEDICGGIVDSAACPFGDYNRHVLLALRNANYRYVYTSDGGPCNPKRWIQPRNTVSRTMDISDVSAMIEKSPSLPLRVLKSSFRIVKRFR